MIHNCIFMFKIGVSFVKRKIFLYNSKSEVRYICLCVCVCIYIYVYLSSGIIISFFFDSVNPSFIGPVFHSEASENQRAS